MEYLKTEKLFDLTHTRAKELFLTKVYPWEVLPEIGSFIIALGETLSLDEYEKRGADIWIHKEADVMESAYIKGPVIIGRNTQVRHCAFIRGNALVGDHAVVGNSTELKNVILFDNVQVPHYNYVGDSILGYKAHMGAGSITSNVKADKKNIIVKANDEYIETGLRKFGAMIGDHVEIGCGAVLNPGCVVGANAQIYPLSMVRGYIPAGFIYKNSGEVIEKKQ